MTWHWPTPRSTVWPKVGCRPEPWIQPRRLRRRASNPPCGEPVPPTRSASRSARGNPAAWSRSRSRSCGAGLCRGNSGQPAQISEPGSGLHQASPQAARGDRSITRSLPVLRAWSAIIATNSRGSPWCRAHASSVMPDSKSAITCVTVSALSSACRRSGGMVPELPARRHRLDCAPTIRASAVGRRRRRAHRPRSGSTPPFAASSGIHTGVSARPPSPDTACRRARTAGTPPRPPCRARRRRRRRIRAAVRPASPRPAAVPLSHPRRRRCTTATSSRPQPPWPRIR